MFHADFQVVKVEDDRVFIIDMNQGSNSVTNDAEWVWTCISSRYPHRRVIYRDTMNRWDEIVPNGTDSFGRFTVDFRPYSGHLPL